MKIIYRIPTEMYAYVEVEKDYPKEPSVVEIHQQYSELTDAFRPKVGLEKKEFNEALDRYLKDGDGETETYMVMSPQQQAVFQEIKKSLKRIGTI